jgi:hypothetical protein
MEPPTGADCIIIVSGLPRSGTSLVMQMLAAGGVPPLTDQKRGPDENNPRGYFEYEAVKQLQSGAPWLDEARGHAVKIIHLLLRHLPLSGHDYRVILVQRALAEVLASQRAMLARAGKVAAADAALEQMFSKQLAAAEQWLSEHKIPYIVVQHRQLLNEPRAVADEIAKFLGRDLDLDAMCAAVDPLLYRERLT